MSEWQTRQTQNLLWATTCGFKSRCRHCFYNPQVLIKSLRVFCCFSFSFGVKGELLIGKCSQLLRFPVRFEAVTHFLPSKLDESVVLLLCLVVYIIKLCKPHKKFGVIMVLIRLSLPHLCGSQRDRRLPLRLLSRSGE